MISEPEGFSLAHGDSLGANCWHGRLMEGVGGVWRGRGVWGTSLNIISVFNNSLLTSYSFFFNGFPSLVDENESRQV